MTDDFVQSSPSLDAYWRAIILFGKNSASYKFALAKTLLELTSQERSFLALDELAGPFANNILEHMRLSKRQGTSQSSKFLQALNSFKDGDISLSQMQERTAQLGFVNVIDAFHVVNQQHIPIRFFVDERKRRNGISITDDFFRLKESFQSVNLPFEVEARWRLVETSWSLGISSNLLTIRYDGGDHSLFVEESELRRINITSSIDALNGYQKGKCFYCFRDISISGCDVDHFFPFTLVTRSAFFSALNINGVWNLVLTCAECNRGEGGKFARVPETVYLERLHRRNSYLINSHHPLRETLMSQTGTTEFERRYFLQRMDANAIQHLIHRWRPKHEFEQTF